MHIECEKKKDNGINCNRYVVQVACKDFVAFYNRKKNRKMNTYVKLNVASYLLWNWSRIRGIVNKKL